MKNQEKVIAEVIEKYKCSAIMLGSMYILSDGTLLYLGDTGFGHSELSETLEFLNIEKDFEPGKASKLLRGLGWIRLNTKIKFIEFTDVLPTAKQEVVLLKALEFMHNDVQVYVKDKTKIYKDRLPEDVLKLVKRCYSSGTLYEQIR